MAHMSKYEVMFEKDGKTIIDTVSGISHYHARGIIHLEYGDDITINYVLRIEENLK